MRLKGMPDYAGEWYVIPLCADLHRLGKNAIHGNKKGFVANYGTEKELFLILIERYKSETGRYPVDYIMEIVNRV